MADRDPLSSFQTVFPRHLPAFAARTRDVYHQLRNFERFVPERQDAILAAQLNHLLRHARQYSPFWSERLCDWKPGRKTVAEVLEGLPPLLRSELQQHPERIAARFPERDALGIVSNTTSGSTGTPVSVELSQAISTPMYHAVTLVCAEWHPMDSRETFGIVGEKTVDLESAPIGVPFSWFGPVGRGFRYSTRGRAMDEIYEYCARRKPAYLQTGPTTAMRLARYARETGRRDLQVELFLTLGSAVTGEIRDLVREYLGAEIVDRYSCEEAGYIALQCPKHRDLHVISPATLVEIVDEEGRLVRPERQAASSSPIRRAMPCR